MAGGIAGALNGVAGVPAAWLGRLGEAAAKQESLAEKLVATALKRAEWEKKALARLDEIS